MKRGTSENVISYVFRRCAERMRLDHLPPHNLRRTCAKFCHVNDGEIEQIQSLLGPVSVLNTEHYPDASKILRNPSMSVSAVFLPLGRSKRAEACTRQQRSSSEAVLLCVHARPVSYSAASALRARMMDGAPARNQTAMSESKIMQPREDLRIYGQMG
jgi:hypothetical protein